MYRTISLHLDVSDGRDSILDRTLAGSRACFNAVAHYGWEYRVRNGVALHKATYYGLRAAHPDLPSQLVISARMKVTEAVKSAFALAQKGRKVGAPRTERGSVRYDARTYRMEVGNGVVGLSPVAGRIKFPFRVHAHARRWLDRATGFDSADLVRRPSGWWLNVVVTIDPPQVAPSGQVVGVDLGINRPAVLSNGKFLGQRRLKEIEQRHFRLRRRLQAKGSRSAKRHLRKMAGRQARFWRDCDHVLSKRIVQGVEPGGIIVLEDLTGIRSRTRQHGRKQRRRHHSWSYAQLRAFTTYKAEDNGSSAAVVDPRKTSQRCSRCGHVHRRNRPTRPVFLCRECGYEVNADWNASRNIAWKYLPEGGMSAFGGRPVNAPIVAMSDAQALLLSGKPPASTGGG